MFQKGQSGNPGGRPRIAAAFKDRAQKFMDAEGANTLISMARGEEPDDRRFALKLLTEYAYGKPTQPLSNGNDDGAPVFSFTIAGRVSDASDG